MPQLGRLYKYALRDNGNATSGVSLNVYREGATVNGTQSGVSPLTVTVLHPGKIKVSDTVFIGTSTSTPYTISTTPTATTIILTGFGGTLNLANGDRIVPSNSRPTIYSDDQGSGSTTNPLTSASDGLWSCFLEFGAYDMLQSGGGLSTKLHPGLVIGSEAPGQIRFADDFAALSVTGGIQEAIDDLPSSGGTVRLSGKTYTNSACVWAHSDVRLEGAGIGHTLLTRATGSITDASANLSGPVVNCGPKGSNGTVFSSGTPGSNITLTNLTLDGNYTAFVGLTNTSLGCSGLQAQWVSGLYMENVKVQNCLQDGWYINNCNGILFNNVHADTVGQWGVSASRNALSLVNNANSTTNVNQGAVSNFFFKTVGDEAIALSGTQSLSISNGTVDGADFGIEITGTSTVPCSDLTFSSMNMRNLLDVPITLAPSAATVTRCSFSDMTFSGHATLHNAGAIYMGTTAVSYSDLKFNNLTFTNINTLDTTARSWIDIQCGSAASRQRMQFSNIIMTGLSGSVRTSDVGINVRGPQRDLFFNNILLKDVAGIGVSIDDAAADTISNIHYNKVVVDGAYANGCQIRNNGFASTIKEIYFDNCVMKDCAKGAAGNNAGWLLQAAFAGSSIDHIYLRGCRSYKTSGANHLYGLNLLQTAGTLGPVLVDNCDFTGTQTAELLQSGTLTGIQFTGHIFSTQSLTAVGNTLVVPSTTKNCTLYVDSDGNYTLTSTPTIADGLFNGQKITIMNVDATPNTFGLQDESGLAGSNLLLDTVLVGGATFTLNQGDNITFAWSSALSAWVSIGMQNGIA